MEFRFFLIWFTLSLTTEFFLGYKTWLTRVAEMWEVRLGELLPTFKKEYEQYFCSHQRIFEFQHFIRSVAYYDQNDNWLYTVMTT